MTSTRDLVIASVSAAAGAVAAAAALRFLSSYSTANPAKPQNPPPLCAEPLAVSGSAAGRAPAQDPFESSKREGFISWDDYFMAIAFLSAEQSKDPNRQVGACLVSQEGIILGIGYNGFPRGCSDDKLPWAKKSARGNPLETKYPRVTLDRENCLIQERQTEKKLGIGIRRDGLWYLDQRGTSEAVYLALASATSEETKSGVSEVIYFVEKRIENSDYVYVASHKLLAMAGVKVRKHQPHMAQIPIKFQEP